MCSGLIPYGYYGAYFVVEKKFHKNYNEKLEFCQYFGHILGGNFED